MATKNRTTPGRVIEPPAPAPAAPPSPDFAAERATLVAATLSEMNGLRNAVHNMDFAATAALTKIRAVVKMTLLAMETPALYREPELVAVVLDLIWTESEMAMGSVNGEALEVACGGDDEAAERRATAQVRSQA